MSKIKLNKVEVKVSKVVIDKEDGIHREDKRKNNPGRPVNKKSARYIRLQKQAFYADVNSKFKKGNQFKVNNDVYKYDGKLTMECTNPKLCNNNFFCSLYKKSITST